MHSATTHCNPFDSVHGCSDIESIIHLCVRVCIQVRTCATRLRGSSIALFQPAFVQLDKPSKSECKHANAATDNDKVLSCPNSLMSIRLLYVSMTYNLLLHYNGNLCRHEVRSDICRGLRRAITHLSPHLSMYIYWTVKPDLAQAFVIAMKGAIVYPMCQAACTTWQQQHHVHLYRTSMLTY